MDKFAAFSEWDEDLKRAVATQLNSDGIVSDEDGLGLSSTWIEAWRDEFTEHLKIFGYQGGEINKVGEYFPHYGAVYALYNGSCVSHSQAVAYIKKRANTVKS